MAFQCACVDGDTTDATDNVPCKSVPASAAAAATTAYYAAAAAAAAAAATAAAAAAAAATAGAAATATAAPAAAAAVLHRIAQLGTSGPRSHLDRLSICPSLRISCRKAMRRNSEFQELANNMVSRPTLMSNACVWCAAAAVSTGQSMQHQQQQHRR